MYRHQALFEHLPCEVSPACRVQNDPISGALTVSPTAAERTSSMLERERDDEFHVCCAIRDHSSGVRLPPEVDRETSCTATAGSAKRRGHTVLRHSRESGAETAACLGRSSIPRPLHRFRSNQRRRSIAQGPRVDRVPYPGRGCTTGVSVSPAATVVFLRPIGLKKMWASRSVGENAF